MKPLGKRRRSFAFLVIGVGILTFFTPLVAVNPPVADKAQWSAFDLAWRMYGPGPVSGPTAALHLPTDIAVVYAFMFLALVVLLFSSSSKVLATIGAIGCIVSWQAWKWDNIEFQRMFYGSLLIGHVQFGRLMFTLLMVMGALVAISLKDGLDAQSDLEGSEARELRRDSTEPEFFDAEILPSEREEERPHGTRRPHD
jgi:hypothetical protein